MLIQAMHLSLKHANLFLLFNYFFFPFKIFTTRAEEYLLHVNKPMGTVFFSNYIHSCRIVVAVAFFYSNSFQCVANKPGSINIYLFYFIFPFS